MRELATAALAAACTLVSGCLGERYLAPSEWSAPWLDPVLAPMDLAGARRHLTGEVVEVSEDGLVLSIALRDGRPDVGDAVTVVMAEHVSAESRFRGELSEREVARARVTWVGEDRCGAEITSLHASSVAPGDAVTIRRRAR